MSGAVSNAMSSAVTERVDVAVIGGGVIGLSIALELRRRGREVVVIERDQPGAATSTVAAGMLAPTSEVEKTDSGLTAFQIDSLGRYPEFVAAIEELSGMECGYRTEGTLWAARNRDDELELERVSQIQAERGLAAQRLSGREVRALEPYLTPRLIGGLFVESDHQIDPIQLLPALETAARRAGVAVRSQTAVTAVEREAEGLRVHVAGAEDGESGELWASVVVLAAGVWSEDGIITPAPPMGLRPVRGQVLHLSGAELLQHVVRTPDPEVYLVPRRGGRLVIGATEEEQGFDPKPSAGGVLDLLQRAWEVLPGIYDLHLEEIRVGFRPTVRDHMPIVGPTATPGVFVATAHYRSGVLLAPATAWWLAEAISGGGTPPLLKELSIARIAGGQLEGVGQ